MEINLSLIDLLNCCRCCTKKLSGDQKAVKISKAIKIRFLELTSIELLDSEYYSSNICESCNSKLSEFYDFRNELTEYQNKLYSMYVEDYVCVEEGDFIYCTEGEPKKEVNESYIIEEVEQTADYGENDVYVTEYREIDDNNYHQQIEVLLEKEKTDEKSTICEVCNQTLAISSYYHHMIRFHSKQSRYFCDYCTRGFNLKTDLLMHIKKHLTRENRTKYPCSQCDRDFLSASSLINHNKAFHTDIVEVHPCEHCFKTFKSRMKYLQHRKLVHENTGSFSCHLCNKTFEVKSYLEKHIINTHGDLQSCAYCGKMYKPASLKRHMLSHNENKIKCPYEGCDKTYSTKLTLKDHIATHHERNDEFNCGTCGACFPTKKHLNRHFQRQHTSEKLKCEVEGCSSFFSRKDYLAVHYKKHKNIDEETRYELLTRVKENKKISW